MRALACLRSERSHKGSLWGVCIVAPLPLPEKSLAVGQALVVGALLC